jgi:hypothetical protein
MRRRSLSVSRRTPESRSPIIIAAANDEDDDTSQLSDDVSVERSAASHSLDAILSKIKDCKAQLKAPIHKNDTESSAEKSKGASHVEKLTASARAIKKFETSAE